MKIRLDFVTNSSSSSFILGFTSEDNLPKELADGFPREYAESLGRVFADAVKADRMTKDEVLEFIRNSLEWDVSYAAESEYMRKNKVSWMEAREYIKSEDGKKYIEETVRKKMEKIEKKMQKKNVFMSLEYGDHGFPDFENDIMPNLKSLLYQISQH